MTKKMKVVKVNDEKKDNTTEPEKKKEPKERNECKDDSKNDEDDEIKNEMKEGKTRIGIFPVTEGRISRFASRDHDLTNVSNEDLFNSHVYTSAIIDAAYSFLKEEMKFDEGDIDIKAVKMAFNGYSHIMWIWTSESTVKRIYQRAAVIKSTRIKLYTFFPHSIYKRKQTRSYSEESSS